MMINIMEKYIEINLKHLIKFEELIKLFINKQTNGK